MANEIRDAKVVDEDEEEHEAEDSQSGIHSTEALGNGHFPLFVSRNKHQMVRGEKEPHFKPGMFPQRVPFSTQLYVGRDQRSILAAHWNALFWNEIRDQRVRSRISPLV